MSGQFFEQITQSLYNRTGCKADDAAFFIAQVLAWAYLSEYYPDEIQPNFFELEIAGITKKEFEAIATELAAIQVSKETAEELKLYTMHQERKMRALRDMVHKPKVLCFNQRFIADLGEKSIQETLRPIAQVLSGGTFNYGEIPQVLWRFLISNSAGFGVLPDDLAQLSLKLSQPDKESSIYCPFSFTFRAAEIATWTHSNINAELFLPIGSGGVPLVCCLTNLFYGSKITIHRTPSFNQPAFMESGKPKLFDIAIASPPWGGKVQPVEDFFGRNLPKSAVTSEAFHINQVLAQVKGRAVFILPPAFLFRANSYEKELKAKLIKDGVLETVISLTGGLLPHTNVPVCLVVVNLNKSTDSVRLIKALDKKFYRNVRSASFSGNKTLAFGHGISDWAIGPIQQGEQSIFCRDVTRSDVAENDYNIDPSRYILDEKDVQLNSAIESIRGKPLSDWVDIIRVQSLKAKADDEIYAEPLEVKIQDIEVNGTISAGSDTVSIPFRNEKRARQVELHSGDVLLSVKGTIGAVGYLSDEPEEPMVPSQSFVILRPKIQQPTATVFLYRYLKSPVAQGWMQSKATGAVMKGLSNQDLKSLPVPDLDETEAQRMMSYHKLLDKITEEIQQLDNVRESIYKAIWPASKTDQGIPLQIKFDHRNELYMSEAGKNLGDLMRSMHKVADSEELNSHFEAFLNDFINEYKRNKQS